MSNRIVRGLLCLALCFVTTACGDDSSVDLPDSGPGVDAATPVDAHVADDAAGGDEDASVDAGADEDAGVGDGGTSDAAIPSGETITATGIIRELGATGAGAVQPGVEVCVDGISSIPCVTTDATGTFTSSEIPADFEFLLRLSKTDFYPALATVSTGTADVAFNYFMVTNSTVGLLGTIVGHPPMAAAGQLFVQLGEGAGAAGATVSVEGDAGEGPFYTNASGIPSTGATSTSTNGTAIFANVPPGDYVVTVTPAAGRTCALTGFAWAGTAPNTVRVTVRAGHVTSSNLDCN